MEQLERVDARLMAEKIREVTGKKRPIRSTMIKNANGTVLTDRNKVLKRWQDYVGELFSDNDRGKKAIENPAIGTAILRREMEEAVRKMRWRKAEGSVGIVVEMVEAAGEFAITKIVKLANRIYQTGIIPDKMKVKLIVIPKKEGAVDCSKNRTISIMNQVANIVLKAIDETLKSKETKLVEEEQYGFSRGRGTRNAIFVLRPIMESCIEKQKDVFMCFVDFEKAFDTVKHKQLVEILEKCGVDGADLRLLKELYWEQRAVVRVGDETSESVDIKTRFKTRVRKHTLQYKFLPTVAPYLIDNSLPPDSYKATIQSLHTSAVARTLASAHSTASSNSPNPPLLRRSRPFPVPTAPPLPSCDPGSVRPSTPIWRGSAGARTISAPPAAVHPTPHPTSSPVPPIPLP